MKIELLTNRRGHIADIEEVKEQWIESLLVYAGVDLDSLDKLSPPDQVEILITEYEIDIVTYPGIGAIRVDKSGDTIGEWAGPEFELCFDKKTDELYYRITIETWTIMEEEIDMG